jgi:hypothetical protein
MKWRIKKNEGEYEDDKHYPINVELSREGSSDLQLVAIPCGNFTSSKTAIGFIREVKRAGIKREISFPEEIENV